VGRGTWDRCFWQSTGDQVHGTGICRGLALDILRGGIPDCMAGGGQAGEGVVVQRYQMPREFGRFGLGVFGTSLGTRRALRIRDRPGIYCVDCEAFVQKRKGP